MQLFQPPESDFELPQSDTEHTVSSLCWSPPGLDSDYLIASSWDSQIRCWEVKSGNTQAKCLQQYDAPVLSTCFSGGTFGLSKVFSGDCSGQLGIWDLASNTKSQLLAHEAPISIVKYVTPSGNSLILTGSWDKTIKYWDARQQGPVGTLNL